MTYDTYYAATKVMALSAIVYGVVGFTRLRDTSWGKAQRVAHLVISLAWIGVAITWTLT